MRSSALLMWGFLLSACAQEEQRHALSTLDLKAGNLASLDIFGRVVVGKRNQTVNFETGVVPIPLVKTKTGIVNLDDLRVLSFSEHAGRASGGYVRARVVNISLQNLVSQRYDDISLSELDTSRRVRTAVAQFPTPSDFAKKGFRAAIFTDSGQPKNSNLVYYQTTSADTKKFVIALGRPLRFPVLVDSRYLIENYK